jgi:hypothetical protein
MANGKQWDLKPLHGLEAACEWIRKGSGSLFVVAVRSGAKPDEDQRFIFDSAIAADPEVPIKDILLRLELEVASLSQALTRQREAAKGKQSDRLSATKQSQR